MAPNMLFAPSGFGNWTVASFSPLPPSGDDACFTVTLPSQFGNEQGINEFILEATDLDGWFMNSLSIQIGDGETKNYNLVNGATTGIWLDSPPLTTGPGAYGGFPAASVWTFVDADAFPTSGTSSDIPEGVTVVADFDACAWTETERKKSAVSYTWLIK